MSETRTLLGKIAALRQQLEQVRGSASDAESGGAALLTDEKDDAKRLGRLEQQLASGARHDALLNSALRQLAPETADDDTKVMPRQLTSRARRILENGRGLLDELRRLGDKLEAKTLAEPVRQADGAAPDPLAEHYRETATMADTALRMVQAFPDAPTAQLRLCEGLEAILEVVAERVAALTAAVDQRQQQAAQVDALAELLTSLKEGKAVEMGALVTMAERLLGEAQQGAPLRFLAAEANQPARFVACHSLTVAQVLARVVRPDSQWRAAVEPVLAALVHDVGMLAVPVEVLARPGPLDDDQRRAVEAHPRGGAEMIGRLPGASLLAEAAAGHHERVDGAGYPAGLRGTQLAPLTRLLAVCDVYAALCTPRPHRPALDTRTALADTLLLAEQGALDRHAAERLLQLSFYPVGSVVELADGAVGHVVATHMGHRDLNTLARPVLALLTDASGRPLPGPEYVDLAECTGRGIVRALPAAERRDLLGWRYPELV
jgi:HD-GYP domain-containing protein (c-di-GMP phosphodiesterase class II)